MDYNDVRPKFKDIEMEQDEKKLTAAETKEALLHPERIREISQYILDNFRVKTHRAHIGAKGLMQCLQLVVLKPQNFIMRR